MDHPQFSPLMDMIRNSTPDFKRKHAFRLTRDASDRPDSLFFPLDRLRSRRLMDRIPGKKSNAEIQGEPSRPIRVFPRKTFSASRDRSLRITACFSGPIIPPRREKSIGDFFHHRFRFSLKNRIFLY